MSLQQNLSSVAKLQKKFLRKTTVPRKEFDRTPFGEHCYLYRITIKIMERATALIGDCELLNARIYKETALLFLPLYQPKTLNRGKLYLHQKKP